MWLLLTGTSWPTLIFSKQHFWGYNTSKNNCEKVRIGAHLVEKCIQKWHYFNVFYIIFEWKLAMKQKNKEFLDIFKQNKKNPIHQSLVYIRNHKKLCKFNENSSKQVEKLLGNLLKSFNGMFKGFRKNPQRFDQRYEALDSSDPLISLMTISKMKKPTKKKLFLMKFLNFCWILLMILYWMKMSVMTNKRFSISELDNLVLQNIIEDEISADWVRMNELCLKRKLWKNLKKSLKMYFKTF